MHSDRKNSIWLASQFLFITFLSLISLKLNLEYFGEKTFGIWILLSSVWGFSSTIDLGMGTTIVKFIAEYKSRNEEKISVLISSSMLVFIVMGLLIFLFGNSIATLMYFNNEKLIPHNLVNKFISIFIILGIAFYSRYLTLFFSSIFEGLGNFVITSKISMIQSVILFVNVIIILTLKLSIEYLSISYFLVYSLTLFVFIYLFKSKYSNYRINIKLFNLQEVKKIFGFSIPVQMMTIFNTLIDPLIKYLIGNFYSIGAIPAYEIARRFALNISGLYFNTFKIVLPKTSALTMKEEQNKFLNVELSQYSILGIIYSIFFYGILVFPIILFIDLFFKTKEASVIFLILSLPESINNYGYGIYNFLLGMGKVKFLAFLQFINLFITSLVLIVGFYFWKNSLAFSGYFFSVIIVNLLMLYIVRKNWNFSPRIFLKDIGVIRLIILVILLMISSVIFLYMTDFSYSFLLTVSIILSFVFFKEIMQNVKTIFTNQRNSA